MNVQTVNTTALLLQLKQIRDLENRLREKKKELEARVFSTINRPDKGQSLQVELTDFTAKLAWTTEARIGQSDARIIVNKYPDIATQVFSTTYKPKISVISRLRMLQPDLPALSELQEYLTVEEKQTITFVEVTTDAAGSE
ncbi:MAG TPA: hypothetical protein PK396_11470 [Mesotoga sp.]|jgi:hypothetical protein|nr:hypothetical protein [Mesotoga infera]HPI18337.1 hypothetical protein [Mesotoga sp.]